MKIIKRAARSVALRLGGPGSPGSNCSRCGGSDGAHVPGCPNER
jgi:hypothetical protein